ncbi:tRNA glutamyl-Q(34) synthetase GluQRS [soil metagenome]
MNDAVPTGRYAPSPTGSLHLGNLRTALAAYCSAKSRGMRFQLRIEDIDEGRCKPEFIRQQLDDLEKIGLIWDAAPIKQSDRTKQYEELFTKLKDRRLVYPCFCSRKDILEAASAPNAEPAAVEPDGARYPGTCAAHPYDDLIARASGGERHSWRLRVDQAPQSFFDGFSGERAIDLRALGGDFVVKRADGLFAYQFACAADDMESGVTEVLRGADLLESGARQAYLIACLGGAAPRYLHIPLLYSATGERLAKRVGSEDLTGFLARGFDITAIISYLAHTLGLANPGERITLDEMVSRWDMNKMPRADVRVDDNVMNSFKVAA